MRQGTGSIAAVRFKYDGVFETNGDREAVGGVVFGIEENTDRRSASVEHRGLQFQI